MAGTGMMQTAWGVCDYPNPPYRVTACCPVCGEECRWLYRNGVGDIVGCDVCLDEIDAEEWEEAR